MHAVAGRFVSIYCWDDSYTLFARVRPPGGAEACGYNFNVSTNLETREQQSCILYTIHAMIQGVNSALSPDQSMLNSRSTATRLSAADVSPAYVATIPRPVYESSFWTSKEACETSHSPCMVRAICMRRNVTRTSPTVSSVCKRYHAWTGFLSQRLSSYDLMALYKSVYYY